MGLGLVAGVLLAGLAGCGDGNPRSTERYCTDLAEQTDQLNVDLVTLDDAEQLVYTKRRMAELIAHHSGQSIEQVIADSERDRWFTAEQAKVYGLVDTVKTRRGEIG